MAFPCADAAVILDFMSKIRSFPNLSSFGTFAKAVTCVLSAGQSVCFRTSLHVIFDRYLETSVKEGERFWHTAGTGAVGMALIGPEVPIPQQMETFWASPSNKTKLQHLTRVLATEKHSQLPIILSGCIAEDEVIPAELIHPKMSENTQMPPGITIDGLTGCAEEADDRLVLHCA